MQGDWQQVVTLGIVAAAGASVGRRLWGQASAFRTRRRAHPVKRANPARPAAAPPAPLIQIQTRPPLHLRRPPGED